MGRNDAFDEIVVVAVAFAALPKFLATVSKSSYLDTFAPFLVKLHIAF